MSIYITHHCWSHQTPHTGKFLPGNIYKCAKF